MVLFNGTLKIGLIEVSFDLTDETPLRDVSGAISKTKLLKRAVQLAREFARPPCPLCVLIFRCKPQSGADEQEDSAEPAGVHRDSSLGGGGEMSNAHDPHAGAPAMPMWKVGLAAMKQQKRKAERRNPNQHEVLQLQVEAFELTYILSATQETTRAHIEAVNTHSNSRRYESKLPVGVAKINHFTDLDKPETPEGTPKDEPAAAPKLWLYRPSDPDHMLPLQKPTDLSDMVPAEQLRQFVPLLRIGMRTGSLADGFMSLNGVGGEPLFPGSWEKSITELEEAAGGVEAAQMTDLSEAAFSFAQSIIGGKMQTLTNFATAALDLQVRQ